MTTTIGIRTRVAVGAAIATVSLFSAVGAIGYVQAYQATRRSQVELLNERLDALEEGLEADGIQLTSRLQLDTSLRVIRTGQLPPPPPEGAVQVVRSSSVPGVDSVVGVASTRQIDQTFATIHRGLWVSVAVAGLLVGMIAWVVVDRALTPVRRLTRQASAIEANHSRQLLQVGASGDELTELATTFNAMLTKLRTADTDRRRFVSDASHELRSPLMVLSADAEYAIGNEAGARPAAELARSVLVQSGRLTTLVDDLLTLASIDEDQPANGRVSTVTEVLAAADADPLATGLGQAVGSLRVPDVSRSIANIVANARRHQASSVEVRVVVNDGRAPTVSVIVDDDGPGVPAAERDEIFKRFYRPDSGRSRPAGGAGLGLAIARAEVAQAGGTISVDTSPLGGARFTVTIPVAGRGPSRNG